MIEQVVLFHEAICAELRSLVQALGGSKMVGVRLQSEWEDRHSTLANGDRTASTRTGVTSSAWRGFPLCRWVGMRAVAS